MHNKVCRHCNSSFETNRSHALYCGSNCRHAFKRNAQAERAGKLPPRHCVRCGEPLPVRKLVYPRAKFCSNRCGRSWLNETTPSVSCYPGISTPTVGAIHELIVGADLLSKGFQVFRALSPSCQCDLAVLIGRRLIRVEVTTGYVSACGGVNHPKKREKDTAKFEALAVVANKIIHYMPKLETWADFK